MERENNMNSALNAYPIAAEQTLRALARYPGAHRVQMAGRLADLFRRRPT